MAIGNYTRSTSGTNITPVWSYADTPVSDGSHVQEIIAVHKKRLDAKRMHLRRQKSTSDAYKTSVEAGYDEELQLIEKGAAEFYRASQEEQMLRLQVPGSSVLTSNDTAGRNSLYSLKRFMEAK